MLEVQRKQPTHQTLKLINEIKFKIKHTGITKARDGVT